MTNTNKVAANTKALRAALSGLNVRVRQGTGCRKGHVYVCMKFGSDRAQRVAAFKALEALEALVMWGSSPRLIVDIFSENPHHFDSVSVLAFEGGA